MRDLKATYDLTCYTSWQKTKLNDRKNWSLLKVYCFYSSQRKTKSNVYSYIYFPAVSYYRGFNKLLYFAKYFESPNGLLYFVKYFAKYTLPFLFTFSRLKQSNNYSKNMPKKILNISSLVTPGFTNCYFSGKYFNCKLILEYCEVKMRYKSLLI